MPRFQCNVTMPNGQLVAPFEVVAADRIAALRAALAPFPTGSRASARIEDQTCYLREVMQIRASSFPLLVGVA